MIAPLEMLADLEGREVRVQFTKSIIEVEPFRPIKSHRNVPREFDRWRKYDGKGPVIRDPSEVTTLGVHHTAVRGGFGVGKNLLKRHKGDELSARMERYAGEPYHAVYSLRDNASIIQWPHWMYTHHGNGMNGYTIGWGMDLDSRFDQVDPDLLILAGSHVVLAFRDLGCPMTGIETHSQHSNKTNDPGRWMMREVLVPLAALMGMTINGAASSGKGKPWKPEDYTA